MAWDSRPAGDAPYWERVGEILRALPPDALACATDASEVACWWRERTTAENAEASVDRLHAALAEPRGNSTCLRMRRRTDELPRTADGAGAIR